MRCCDTGSCSISEQRNIKREREREKDDRKKRRERYIDSRDQAVPPLTCKLPLINTASIRLLLLSFGTGKGGGRGRSSPREM